MKITPDPIHVGQIAQSQKTQKTKKTTSKGFGNNLKTQTATQTSASAGVQVTASILAVQEVSDQEHRRKQTIKRGNALLDILDDVRKEMVLGAPNLHRLQQLKEILNTTFQGADTPELQEVLAQIELRAHVEIAKREKTT